MWPFGPLTVKVVLESLKKKMEMEAPGTVVE